MMSARLLSRSCTQLSSRSIPKSVSGQIVRRNLSSSANCKAATVRFDQTKKDNDPNAENTDEQTKNAQPAPKDASEKHPAKHPEPEEPTSRKTGIKSEGQVHQAGEGKNENVHKENREQPGPHMTWGGKK